MRTALVVVLLAGAVTSAVLGQGRASHFKAKDPGPRPNPTSPIPNSVGNLNGNEAALFAESLLRVSELEGSCDTCAQQPQGVPPIDPDPNNPFSPTSLVNSAGMSPVFNADQCFICHSQPMIGGSTPAHSPAEKIAHRLGGTNTVPSFEEPDGPFREVRFKFNEDGSRDGGVHSLFTLQGRSDTPGCTLEQPDFDKAVRERNIAFRIPLQLFGLGLIEGIQDSAIRANMNANKDAKRELGIIGHPNIVPNNGTISRFGWKAQNGSLTIFAGEAYNVEMGISNDEFPIGRSEDANCNVVYEPFDIPRTEDDFFKQPTKIMPAWLMFAEFMRFVDAPQPVPLTTAAQHGKELFAKIGCALCHTPSFQTPGTGMPKSEREEIGPHTVALRGQDVNLYSDLLVHHMGATLADNIAQGNAGPDEFRTTPLWGIGQRLFFLHDGRTNDLNVAIQDHFSRRFSDGGDNPAKDFHSYTYGPSEANAVVERFNALSEAEKQAILDFLRSL
jgi:di-heme oxidoreductase (putative peroxidase)